VAGGRNGDDVAVVKNQLRLEALKRQGSGQGKGTGPAKKFTARLHAFASLHFGLVLCNN
jgi:hypothetical protein